MHGISKYKLIKIEDFDGTKAPIYTIEFEDGSTLFDNFIAENISSHRSEVLDIVDRIRSINAEVGLRAQYFKESEGAPGDGVCALYDKDESNLRLYCIKYGGVLLVLGSGGPKSKLIKALQEDKKLTEENYFMRQVSQDITQKMKDKDIKLLDSGFEGDLIFIVE